MFHRKRERRAPEPLFGLKFCAPTRVPGVSSQIRSAHADVRIEFSISATERFRDLVGPIRYRSPTSSGDEEPDVLIEELENGAFLRLRYGDGVEFVLDRAGTRIFGSWNETSSAEDAAVYLCGPISGLLLYLRGTTCLHASAVEVDDQALLFVGAAEAGKSTTAACFARMGFRVLTDDIAAIREQDGGLVVMPGVPRVQLWPPSVEALWGNANALPRLVPTWEKCYFDLEENQLYRNRAAQIRAVYVLEDRTNGSEISIAPLREAEALLHLLANTYVTRIVEPRQRQKDFATLSALVGCAPPRRVSRPDDRSRLIEVCESIVLDLGGPGARTTRSQATLV